MINAMCFAGMMLRYLLQRARFWIVDFVMSPVGKGVNSRNPVSATYPWTAEAIIV
jgi:hypothetical protein